MQLTGNDKWLTTHSSCHSYFSLWGQKSWYSTPCPFIRVVGEQKIIQVDWLIHASLREKPLTTVLQTRVINPQSSFQTTHSKCAPAKISTPTAPTVENDAPCSSKEVYSEFWLDLDIKELSLSWRKAAIHSASVGKNILWKKEIFFPSQRIVVVTQLIQPFLEICSAAACSIFIASATAMFEDPVCCLQREIILVLLGWMQFNSFVLFGRINSSFCGRMHKKHSMTSAPSVLVR